MTDKPWPKVVEVVVARQRNWVHLDEQGRPKLVTTETRRGTERPIWRWSPGVDRPGFGSKSDHVIRLALRAQSA